MIEILYIDDEIDLLDIGKHYLERSKHIKVDTASSVSLGLEKLAQKQYDAIVSDYQMPEMNGIDFLKKLRSSGNDIPFILFTGRGREEVVIEALNSGADFYLQKGSDVKAQYMELEHKIRSAVARHRAEGTMREQRSHLEALIDSSDRIVFSVDTEYRYTAFNNVHKAVMKEIYGVDIELGKNQLAYQTVTEDRARVKKNLDRALSGERFTETAISGDTELVEFEVEHNPIKGTDGRVVGVAVYATKLTERRRLEAAFQASQRRYEALFNAYNEGAALQEMIYDEYGRPVDYRFLDVNSAFERLTNVTKEQAIGRSATEVLGNPPYFEIYEKVARTGEPVSFETYYPPLKKHFSISAFSTARGQFATVFMDITERKEASEQLVKSEERFRNLADNTFEGISISIDGAIVDINNTLSTMLGFSPQEVIGRRLTDFFTPESLELVNENLKQPVVGPYEARIKNRKGDVLTVQVRGKNIVWNGMPARFGAILDITEAKQIKNELREVENLNRLILDHAGIGLGCWTRDGRAILMNVLAATRLNGVPGDFIGRSMLELFGEEAASVYMGRIERAWVSDSPIEYEDFVSLPSGDGWYLSVYTRTTDPSGNVIAVNVFSHDITEWKRAEKRLSDSENRLRTLVETLPDLIWLKDAEGVYMFCNPQFGLFFGAEESAIVGRTDYDFVDKGLADFFRERDMIAVKEGRPTRNEEWVKYNSDGRRVLLETIKTPMYDDDGSFIGILGIGRDITKRKQIEDELRDSKEKYSVLIDGANEAIVVSQDGRLRFVNPATTLLTGYSAEELMSGSFMDFIHPDDRDLVWPTYLGRLEGWDVPSRYEFRLLTKSGLTKWVEVSVVAVNWEGRPAALNFLTDKTERKQAEMQLHIAKEQLEESHHLAHIGTWDWQAEKDIVVWSSELYNILGLDPQGPAPPLAEQGKYYTPNSWKLLGEAVRRAMDEGEQYRLELEMVHVSGRIRNVIAIGTIKRDQNGRVVGLHGTVQDFTGRKQIETALAEANRKLNLLSSITRHDLINQSAIFQSYLDMLEDRLRDPAFAGDLSRLKQTASRISSIIEFTSAYEDIGVVAPAWHNLGKLISNASSAVSLGAVRIKNEIPGDVEVYADPLIEKVFYNLIDNAVRYGRTITTVHFTLEEMDGKYAVVCSDDGGGISAEFKKNLFTRGSGQNHGLGLFLSREILAITGIEITEEGRPGNGVRFVLAIPSGALRL